MSWAELHIADLVDAGEAEVKTGPFGTQLRASDYVHSGTPVINVRNIGFGTIRQDKLEFIAEDTVRRLSSHLLKAGDIVFGRKGAVERHVFIQEGNSGWFQGSDCLRLRVVDARRALPRYLSYVFLGQQHQEWMMQQCSHGATMASLNQDIIRRIPLRLPPLPTQKRIAAILSAYDDLIENNTRRIAILEEMAQRLYEEWFVHFRFPGHEQVEFDGDLPNGWATKQLQDVARLVMGQSPKSEFYNQSGEGLAFHQGVSDFGTFFPTDRLFCTVEGRIAEEGDILVSVRAPVGRINIATKKMVIGRGLCAIRSSTGHQNLLLSQLRDRFAEEDSMGSGAIFNAVTKKDMQTLDLVCPPLDLSDRFEKLVSPFWHSIKNLSDKCANLRAQRDLLLPKLVSGEIDVTAAETTLEAAE